MGERDPTKPQLDFPQLVSDILEQLVIRGQIGLLDFDPTVRPVYLAAVRAGISLGTFSNPTFNSAAVFGNSSNSPVAGALLVDTLQQAAGTYDLTSFCSHAMQTANPLGHVQLQHRNAANTATLAVLNAVAVRESTVNNAVGSWSPLVRYEIALNERLRWVYIGSLVASGPVDTGIILRLVPAP